MTKKIFTPLMALLFIVPLCAQQVEEVQRTVIAKRTATWCSNCGNWGWTLMENLIADNADKAILIAAHESGSNLGIDASEDITSNWGTTAQPSFFVNEMNQGANSSNIAAKRTDIKDQVDAAFSSSPIANVGFEPVYQDGQIKVDAKVKFFQQASGNYYLGVYLLEDNVISAQSGSVSDDNHKRVMQYCFTDGSWGLPVTDGSVAAGTEFDLSYSLPIGNPTGSDYHVVGIIYDLDGGVYKPINAWSTTTIGVASDVDEIVGLTNFEVNPTLVKTNANVQLELAENQSNTSLDMFDLTGRKVINLYNGELNAGMHTFQIDREATMTSGVYFVRFSSGEKVNTKRVVFQ